MPITTVFLWFFVRCALVLRPLSMKNLLLILLVLIAFVMLYLGASKSMIPPALTGVGFLLIAGILKSID